MTIISDSILVESKTARETELAKIESEQAAEILNKIKSLYFALWKGTTTTVTEQVAEFYEVSEGNLRNFSRWKSFFRGDR